MKYKVGDMFRLKHYKGGYLIGTIKRIYPKHAYPYKVVFEDGSKDAYMEVGLDFGKKLDTPILYHVGFVIQQY